MKDAKGRELHIGSIVTYIGDEFDTVDFLVHRLNEGPLPTFDGDDMYGEIIHWLDPRDCVIKDFFCTPLWDKQSWERDLVSVSAHGSFCEKPEEWYPARDDWRVMSYTVASKTPCYIAVEGALFNPPAHRKGECTQITGHVAVKGHL